MKKKNNPFQKTYILVVFAIIIVIIAYLDNPYSDNEKQSYDEKKLLFENFSTEDISNISIVQTNKDIQIQKNGENWSLTNDNNYKADQESVENIKESIKTIKRGEKISENPEKQSSFNVSNDSGLLVTFTANNETESMYIGKVGTSRDSQYIRLKDSDEVLLVRKNLDQVFNKTHEQLRDKTILNIDKNTISEISFVYENKKNTFLKKDETWTLNGENINQEKFETILSLVSNIQAAGFVMPEELEEGNNYNTTEENALAKIFIKTNTSDYTIYIGKVDENVYAKKDQQTTIFEINEYLLNQLNITPEDYKEETDTQ
jgi:hypothetical protein